ncbi:hypothetical protein [Acidisphaera sp. S103]|uniref:hypothetical protein n=1 Tax=Acidisphaera sp. S103 TaxID=1747223 RepID=UPI001C20A81F|nr:hypothetical protein [Acidisphaera sp. S103]
MDTHIATHPDLDPGSPGMSARLPGEADETSPATGEPEAGGRLPSSGPKPGRRRRGKLLAGVALAAVIIAGGAFLVSPHNKVYSVPHPQASVNSAAQNAARSAQGTLRPILAPSASLAKVSVPPTPPATRDTFAPRPRDQEVAELLSLHPGSTDPVHADHAGGSSSEGQPVKPAAVHATAAPASTDASEPAGYVPREPGSFTAPPTPAVASSSPKPPVTAAVAPAGATPKDATALIIASLPQAQLATIDTPAVPPTAPAAVAVPRATEPPAPSAPAPAIPAPSTPPAILAVATRLRASPMSPPEQVQVLNLVTEMAAMLKDLRKQQAQLRSDLVKSSADVTAHLTDDERRLALAEARSAVTAAADTTGKAAVNAPAAPASDPVAGSLEAIPVAATRPIAVVPSPLVPSAPKVYRVQAASPGLALLAQVDRGGGDGAQMQVVVGDTVPDYGRVKSIAQKGTNWVVTTDHGAIQ